MSESKQECPFCKRAPGEQHRDFCSRSKKHMDNIAAYRDRLALLRKMRVPVEDPTTGDRDPVLVRLGNEITSVTTKF